MATDTQKENINLLCKDYNRQLVIANFLRTSCCGILPFDLMDIIVIYSKCYALWKPQWPQTEDYIYLEGRVMGSDGCVNSYHWRNAGGTIISLNSLPTISEREVYGDIIQWNVEFHRKSHCRQYVGLVPPPRKKLIYTSHDYKFGIDGDGWYVQLKAFEIEEDDDLTEDEFEDEDDLAYYEAMRAEREIFQRSHWYIPEKIELGYGDGVIVETYLFRYDIVQQTLTIFDPNMKKMGDTTVDYTWRVNMSDKWHLFVKCESAGSRIKYEFIN
eukprot:247703_1